VFDLVAVTGLEAVLGSSTLPAGSYNQLRLSITKVAYKDDQVTPIGASLVLPGQFIQYKVTVTNTGVGPATSVQISDALPAQLTFSSSSPDAGGWTIGNVGNNVTATLTGSLASAASRFIWIRAQVN